jgi:hypothetical protein
MISLVLFFRKPGVTTSGDAVVKKKQWGRHKNEG